MTRRKGNPCAAVFVITVFGMVTVGFFLMAMSPPGPWYVRVIVAVPACLCAYAVVRMLVSCTKAVSSAIRRRWRACHKCGEEYNYKNMEYMRLREYTKT